MLLSEKVKSALDSVEVIDKDIAEIKDIQDAILKRLLELKDMEQIVGEFPAREGYDITSTPDGTNFVYISHRYSRSSKDNKTFFLSPLEKSELEKLQKEVEKEPWYKRIYSYVCDLSK